MTSNLQDAVSEINCDAKGLNPLMHNVPKWSDTL